MTKKWKIYQEYKLKELNKNELSIKCYDSWGYERLQKSKDSFKDCFEM